MLPTASQMYETYNTHLASRQRTWETNLIYVIKIIFFWEVLVCLLPLFQHLHINRSKHPNHACKDHYHWIIWKQHLVNTEFTNLSMYSWNCLQKKNIRMNNYRKNPKLVWYSKARIYSLHVNFKLIIKTTKGRHTSPEHSSAKIQPRDQMSILWSYGRPRITSGAR